MDPVLTDWLGKVAGIIAVLAFFPYILSILKLRTTPNRVTWFALTLNGWLALVSYKEVGAGATVWLAWCHAIMPAFVFLLSIKYGEGGRSRSDLYCLAIAMVGLLIWRLTESPLMGLLCFLLADFAALFPTICKSWSRPYTEDRLAWSITTVSATVNLLAIDRLELGVVVHPVYMFLLDGFITYLLWRSTPSQQRAEQ